uniref:SCAN box domain-containing protein n=1 Tax=Pygocentrus nattereri TaxID=42514 RepID=A0AAR2LUH6_PYGNA
MYPSCVGEGECRHTSKNAGDTPDLSPVFPAGPTPPIASQSLLGPGAEAAVVGESSSFPITKHITLVPPFCESEVDTYFSIFERMAVSLKWPKEFWTLLLQCRLTGKARDVCSSLSLSDSMEYEAVKAAILRAYELVPEAYRQRFREYKKSPAHSYVEFTREKALIFDKWVAANKVSDFESLRELMLLEDFKNGLPDRIAVYLNESKVSTLSQAAVLADEFANLPGKNSYLHKSRMPV